MLINEILKLRRFCFKLIFLKIIWKCLGKKRQFVWAQTRAYVGIIFPGKYIFCRPQFDVFFMISFVVLKTNIHKR
jgi:hypothetical protein